jgi:hypothetical protein
MLGTFDGEDRLLLRRLLGRVPAATVRAEGELA